jgi:hypothetical protein
MNREDREYLRNLLQNYKRVQKPLEGQHATFTSLHAPPHVMLSIEETKAEIARIESQLYPSPPSPVHKVALWTRSSGSNEHFAGKQFDWTEYFEQNPNGLSREQDATLQQEVAEYAASLDRSQTTNVALEISAHLSAAMAFGKAFSSQSRYSLWVKQQSPAISTQWWNSKLSVDLRDLDYIHQDLIQVKKSSEDIYSVEVCFSKNKIGTSVNHAIDYLGLPITKRLTLEFAGDKEIVEDAWEAQEIALTVHKFLKQAYKANPDQTIHFFCAIPVGLAVLIGTHIKSLCPIQCYDFNNATRQYSPGCLL